MAPVVAVYQAMRRVSFLVAVTFVAEIGDLRRFDSPRQFMSFLGLVFSERSTGETVRRGGLTLAGNRRPAGCSSKGLGPIAIPPASARPCAAGSTVCQRRSRHRLPARTRGSCFLVAVCGRERYIRSRLRRKLHRLRLHRVAAEDMIKNYRKAYRSRRRAKRRHCCLSIRAFASQ
jgi:transposase IS116/IS110/IS902 family protein